MSCNLLNVSREFQQHLYRCHFLQFYSRKYQSYLYMSDYKLDDKYYVSCIFFQCQTVNHFPSNGILAKVQHLYCRRKKTKNAFIVSKWRRAISFPLMGTISLFCLLNRVPDLKNKPVSQLPFERDDFIIDHVSSTMFRRITMTRFRQALILFSMIMNFILYNRNNDFPQFTIYFLPFRGKCYMSISQRCCFYQLSPIVTYQSRQQLLFITFQ